MMKKKIYIQPDMVVVNVDVRQMLCASIQQSGDNLSITFDDSEFESGQTINARGSGFWDDEE
jgi:hypothetical protein